MNSALKPVLASAGVPTPAGQSSPAKGNVASANHASVGHPQGAQNSLNHANNGNNVPAQNLHAPAPAPQAPPHAVPSMAPVSANMAQMAQNMSNHGNLSQVNQSSPAPAPAPAAASPSKAPSTSSPLSLVAEKANASQPLALTRSPDKPEKKEPDSTAQSNGTIESPKSATNAPVTLKAQNTDANKDKPDIAKTSPSTTKPPEKAALPATPQKPETSNPSTQADLPTQPKAATASEPSEKSPAKPAEPKPAPTADVAPTQSDTKPAPESASNSEPSPPEKEKEKPPTPAKLDHPAESAKPEPVKVEEKIETAPEKPSIEEKPKQPEVKEKSEPPKAAIETKPKVAEKEKVEAKKEVKPKSTLKLATVTPPLRKRRQASPSKGADGPTPAKKPAEGESPADARTKRNRTKVQLYQSPTPELAMATKLSASAGRSTPTKQNDDKLIVFYKNEYLAVRNAEGGFYVCQTMQNVYRTTRKIKIRWLSQDKTADPSGETYKPDFYDVTDMECVLTTLSLTRASGTGGAWILRAAEQARATSILQRALKAETSGGSLQLTPEHPDGLDLSLYTDESQIEKRRKRAASKSSPRNKGDAIETVTATAVIEKAKAAAKATPKRTPAKQAKPEPVVTTPLRKGGRRAAAKEAVPSTSTGKTGRTPRKLPQRK